MLAGENNILIYCDLPTKRFTYVCNIILKNVLGLDYLITSDKDLFEKKDSPKFSYAIENHFTDHSFLSSHYLLFETNIHKIDLDIFEFEGLKAFFKTRENSFYPFDIFAASFYLISRYEEYLPFKNDKYGRFKAEDSLAFREGFLELPLVNIWANFFSDKLCHLFPELKPQKTKFQFLSTIDVDNAWAHLHKGFVRTSLAFAKLIINLNFKGLIEKFKVLAFGKIDPYDSFSFLDEIHKKYEIEPIYFFLFSKYSSKDKNPSQKNEYFRKLIKDISHKYIIGIHPSYQSNKSYQIVENEKNQLEQLIEKSINISRQHFLYLKMSDTYDNLLKIGISQDFSMGYSSQIGFRASFCLPYKFFNLKTNEETSLEIIPFAFMDVCFRDYQKIKPEIALIQIKKIISSIKKVDGLFVSIWHNETLPDKKKLNDWRVVFNQMMIEIKNGN